MDTTQAIQNARTSNDHEHWQSTTMISRETFGKRRRNIRNVCRYEAITARDNPLRSRSGERDSTDSKQAPSLISHCGNLVRLYEQAEEQNAAMAKAHRNITAEMKSEHDLRRMGGWL